MLDTDKTKAKKEEKQAYQLAKYKNVYVNT